MSQYNKLSDIQYARFQILPVDLHFGLFWSAGIPTMLLSSPEWWNLERLDLCKILGKHMLGTYA